MTRAMGVVLPGGLAERRPGAALAVAAGLVGAAICGSIYDFSIRSQAPKVPLSGWIGPARTAELRFAQLVARGAVSPSLAADARAVGGRDLLAYEPYLLAAAGAFPTERSAGTSRAADLLREALRRNPRSAQARALLLRRALLTGDVREAIGQIAMLDRLNRDYAIALLGGLGRGLTTKAQIDEANRELSLNPALYREVVRGFTAVAKPAPLVAQLAGGLQGPALRDIAVTGPLVDRLVELGDIDAGHALWRRAGGDRAGPALLSDPAFAVSDGHPPFAWKYAQTDSGVAERQRQGGGVFIDYYGRDAGSLLRQLVTLAPGTYRLTIVYEPLGRTPGTLAARVSCASRTDALAQVSLQGGSAAGRRKLAFDFVVPNGCRGQWVEFAGLPDMQRRGQQAIVYRADLTRGAR